MSLLKRPVVLPGSSLLCLSFRLVVVAGVVACVLAVVVAIAFVVTRCLGRTRGGGVGTAATWQGNQGGNDEKGTGKLNNGTNHQFPF